MRTASIAKGVISQCWERKGEIRNRKHQPIMARKSCLRCRRALSYRSLCRSAKPGDGGEDREWEDKKWSNKGRKVRKLLLLNRATLPHLATGLWDKAIRNRTEIIKWKSLWSGFVSSALVNTQPFAGTITTAPQEMQSTFPDSPPPFPGSKAYRRITTSVFQPAPPARSEYRRHRPAQISSQSTAGQEGKVPPSRLKLRSPSPS